MFSLLITYAFHTCDMFEDWWIVGFWSQFQHYIWLYLGWQLYWWNRSKRRWLSRENSNTAALWGARTCNSRVDNLFKDSKVKFQYAEISCPWRILANDKVCRHGSIESSPLPPNKHFFLMYKDKIFVFFVSKYKDHLLLLLFEKYFWHIFQLG